MEKNARYRNIGAYLNEDRYAEPYESFKALGRLLESSTRSPGGELLDIGCATGGLVNYLKTVIGTTSFAGIDIFDEAIAEARRLQPDSEWQTASVLDLPKQWTNRFSIVTMLSVLGVLDENEIERALSEISRVTCSGATLVFFGVFNEFDLDMEIRHRKYSKDSEAPGGWEKGWNVYSRRTLGTMIGEIADDVQFHPFEMPFDLAPKDDPIRTWTFIDTEGRRRLTNGMKLTVDTSFITARVR